MNDDGLGDSRHWAATALAKDMPAAYPGGPSHKAGTPLFLSTLTRTVRGELIGFTMPSPTALGLSISIQASKKADILKGEITFQRQISPHGDSRGVPSEQATRLYDFFEQCMITVAFSFNALEVFCNQTVADELKGTYSRSAGRGQKKLTAERVQRELSTEEKLATVLPMILGTDTPRDALVWADFKRLKRARDSTIHMKAEDAYKRGEIERQSLFHEFFSMDSLMGYPIFAVEVIRFFNKADQEERRWLTYARELAGILESARRPSI